MIYTYIGEEKILLEKQLANLISKNEAKDHVKLDALEITNEELIEEIMTPSFFGDGKLIVIKNSYFITGANPKVKNKIDLEELQENLKNIDEGTVVVFYQVAEKLDSRKKFVKWLSENSTVVTAKKVTGVKLKEGVIKAASARGVDIQSDAIDKLLEIIPESIDKIVAELDKFKLMNTKITVEIVDQTVTKPIDQNVFEMTNAAFSGNKALFYKKYKDLMLTPNTEIMIIALLGNQLITLRKIILGNKDYLSIPDIAKKYKLNQFVVSKNKNVANKLDLKVVEDLILDIEKLDTDIKRGNINAKLGLDIFVAKMIDRI